MTFNLEGYKRNRFYLTDLITQHEPKLIFLQELWIAHYEQHQLSQDFPSYHFHVATPDIFDHSEESILLPSHTWHGAAIAWHNSLQSLITPLAVTHDRFSAIKIRFSSECNILAISLYAPTAGKDEEFHESLDFLSRTIANSENTGIIIGTDSNCSSKSSKRRQAAWYQFCNEFSLQIVSTNSPTFHHNNGSSESCIDYFVVANCEVSELGQFCTLDSPTNLSSHDPITATLKQIDSENFLKYSGSYSSFQRKKVVWNVDNLSAYKELSNQALTNALSYFNSPGHVTLLC